VVATGVVRASTTRVALVWPHHAIVQRGFVDVRSEPRDDEELVDQAHFGERLRVLGEHGEWRYVQGEDQYFGWIGERAISATSFDGRGSRVVAVLLAEVRERPDPVSPVIGHMPAGAPLTSARHEDQNGGKTRDLAQPAGGWHAVLVSTAESGRARSGFVAADAVVDVADLPHRYPTPDDLLRTAEAFFGVPYLWGGTTALGMDCSGFVQQVYRLNGVALPRDADQQAMLGRRVEEARAGDLLFFGAESVTHVALATSGSEFIHAPKAGGAVERSQLGGDRRLLATRRYLPEVTVAEGQ